MGVTDTITYYTLLRAGLLDRVARYYESPMSGVRIHHLPQASCSAPSCNGWFRDLVDQHSVSNVMIDTIDRAALTSLVRHLRSCEDTEDGN